MEARQLLGQVLEAEPRHAAARALTAFTHVNDYINGWAPDAPTALTAGLEMARQAVALDDTEPLAHFALSVACLWSRDLDSALAEAERCLELAPNLADGFLVLAHIRIFAGMPEKAIEAIDTLMRLDPLYPEIALQFLAEAKISLGRIDEAVAILEQRLERRRDSATCQALLAACHGLLGQAEAARDAWEQALRLDPSFSIARRREVLPYRDPTEFERRVEGLRQAGIQA